MHLKKLIIIMVALCFVASVVNPVQAYKTHTNCTMHVGEEKTLILDYTFITNILTEDYDERYIEEIASMRNKEQKKRY